MIVKVSTAKNIVKLESIESGTVFKRGWGVARADVGDIIQVGIQFVGHSFRKRSGGVGWVFFFGR